MLATLGESGSGVILWAVSTAATPRVLYQHPWPCISPVDGGPPVWTLERTGGRVVLAVVDFRQRTYRYDVTAARRLVRCQEDFRGKTCGVRLKG